MPLASHQIRLLWIITAKYLIIIIKVKSFSFIESVFYVSCMCRTLVREDKDFFFCHNSQNRYFSVN